MPPQVAMAHRFVSSLVFTSVVETVVLILLVLYLFRKQGIELWRMVVVGVFASFSTIPYVWFVFPRLFVWPQTTAILFAELFAWIVEAVVYRVFLNLSWKQAFIISLLCNMASYFLGPLLRAQGLWIYW